jgi:hypothetical protein
MAIGPDIDGKDKFVGGDGILVVPLSIEKFLNPSQLIIGNLALGFQLGGKITG